MLDSHLECKAIGVGDREKGAFAFPLGINPGKHEIISGTRSVNIISIEISGEDLFGATHQLKTFFFYFWRHSLTRASEKIFRQILFTPQKNFFVSYGYVQRPSY